MTNTLRLPGSLLKELLQEKRGRPDPLLPKETSGASVFGCYKAEVGGGAARDRLLGLAGVKICSVCLKTVALDQGKCQHVLVIWGS